MKTLNEKLYDVDRAHREWKESILSDQPLGRTHVLYIKYVECVQRATFHQYKE